MDLDLLGVDIYVGNEISRLSYSEEEGNLSLRQRYMNHYQSLAEYPHPYTIY